MYHLDNKSGVTVMPPLSDEFSSAELFFTEGGGGVNPSWPGAAWFNIVQSELLNVLKEAGVTPEKTQLNQVSTAIKKMLSNRRVYAIDYGDIPDGKDAAAETTTIQKAIDAVYAKGDRKSVV